MSRIFVDTSAFFAACSRNDVNHSAAVEALAAAREDGIPLLTTNAVAWETYTLLVKRIPRIGRELALDFFDQLDGGLADVEWVTPADEQQARAILLSHSDKLYSFCDALSFAVTTRLDVTAAIAFDRHFREYGRLTLI